MQELSDDLVIRKNTTFRAGTYRVKNVRIEGDDLTLDFDGAVIEGGTGPADEFTGTGIYAEKCRNLTVKNLTVRGVKVGMHFKECPGLTIVGCDVSRNYRQRLKSTPKAEDLGDWLSGHENDDNQWLRYGAGIYVESSKNVTIARNRARNGQNGICVVRVDDSWIYDNDMSFLSGWGLAMWRSCRNDISNNKFDWCMRGFSYKVYHRGQDSTGILVYEQCHDNVFAYNSATHGGDGFFLYAGNETLQKTGEGGCNRNLLYRNDFSHAAANGIEATFSDGNRFIENILDECDHGIWGGYSYNTIIVGNRIRNCNNGISIEHGSHNLIDGNVFEKNGTAVNLWWNSNDDFKKTAFGSKRDTTSHDYTLIRNSYCDNTRDVFLSTTTRVRVEDSCRVESDRALLEGKIDLPKYEPKVPKTRGTQNAYLPKEALRGWKYIFVDEWGPYDFSNLRVFPQDAFGSREVEVYVLGPEGEFEISGDADVTPRKGRLPATLTVRGTGKYAFTVTAGKETAEARGFLLAATWDVKVYAWKHQGAQKPPKEIAGDPIWTAKLDRLDFTERPHESVPADLYATVATTEFELEGTFEVSTISDDGVRVWIDGKLVIDNWTWHGPTLDKATVTLAKGKHAVKVEHFEIDGYAQLKFEIRPKSQ